MFFYQDDKLKVGSGPKDACDLEAFARASEGPSYIYDLDDVELRYQALNHALEGRRHTIHYAMKANANAKILRKFGELGSGIDTVSGGEIKLALAAGIKPERIIFSGVAKTVSEIEFALKQNIKQINVESPEELRRVAKIAGGMGLRADVVFRLNPDVNPKTHPYITTGFRENKFGMDASFVPELLEILAKSSHSLRLRGLSMHIGSLLFDLGVIREAITKTIAVYQVFCAAGHVLDRLDIGGGLGIRYENTPDQDEFALIDNYGKMARELTEDLAKNPDFELLTEPGRILVARSGVLLCEVQYIKKTKEKTFVIVDSGMNHLLRPALYSAVHRILPVQKKNTSELLCDVVGPICESSDFFAKNIRLPILAEGDLLAIADTGAYGYTMASRYNAHELPTEVVVYRGHVI